MTVRAYYRGCPGPAWNRVHIVNDARVQPREREPGSHAWCGQAVRGPCFLSPVPAALPRQFAWCAPCIGRYAEHLGLLGDIAESVISYDPYLWDPGEERWWLFLTSQREVRRERLLRGRR